MNPAFQVRSITDADLVSADALRAAAGWNQTIADWQRFLMLEPGGSFLAAWDGVVVGTTTTLVYGPDLAWIGMMLVHPEYRRRGIAHALMDRCLEYLHGRSVRCIKLDATPAGKPLYEQFGFTDEWTLTRWHHAGFIPAHASHDSGIRPWRAGDSDLVSAIDVPAFGVSRQRLLESLASGCRTALTLQRHAGHIEGFAMLRPGSRALYLGPVNADNARDGVRLLEAVTEKVDGGTIFWDIPNLNTAATAWAREHGFIAQRPLTRMYLGVNSSPGDPQKQFALAGPEVG